MRSKHVANRRHSWEKEKSVVTITFAIICGPQGVALFTVITWGIQQGKEQEKNNEIILQFRLKPGLMDDPCFFQEAILKKKCQKLTH